MKKVLIIGLAVIVVGFGAVVLLDPLASLFSDYENPSVDVLPLDVAGVEAAGTEAVDAEDAVTRERFAQIVVSLFEEERVPREIFNDVPLGRWSNAYVASAVDRMIILPGDYGENLGADTPITREEAAVWMVRALGIATGGGTLGFFDAGSISYRASCMDACFFALSISRAIRIISFWAFWKLDRISASSIPKASKSSALEMAAETMVSGVFRSWLIFWKNSIFIRLRVSSTLFSAAKLCSRIFISITRWSVRRFL